ncbi:hypothetical protein MHA_0851 [Mannheimia haemolytica PHL213]|nr:hypothetical protein MHA_0851 [Mannheimia haemolytica PHL213]
MVAIVFPFYKRLFLIKILQILHSPCFFAYNAEIY